MNELGPRVATVLRLDTTDLDSIDTFAEELSKAGIARLDVTQYETATISEYTR